MQQAAVTEVRVNFSTYFTAHFRDNCGKKIYFQDPGWWVSENFGKCLYLYCNGNSVNWHSLFIIWVALTVKIQPAFLVWLNVHILKDFLIFSHCLPFIHASLVIPNSTYSQTEIWLHKDEISIILAFENVLL